MDKQGEHVVAPPAEYASTTATNMPGFKPKEKKERTPKQIAAFERMREKRQEQRRLGLQGLPTPKMAADPSQTPASLEKEEEEEEEKPYDRKSLEQAAAMFMEMRKRDKETKKDLSWEKHLNEVVTKRMDEFEDRLIKLFDEPIEQYVAKKQRKKVTIQEPTKEDKKQPEILEEPIEDYYPPPPIATKRAPKKQSPFVGRKAVEAFAGYPETLSAARTKPSPFRQRYVPQQY